MRAARGKWSSLKFQFESCKCKSKWNEEAELTVGIKSESTQHLSLMARSPQGWIMKIMKLARKRLEWWLEVETPRDSMNSSILCTFSSFRNSSMFTRTQNNTVQVFTQKVLSLSAIPCVVKCQNLLFYQWEI